MPRREQRWRAGSSGCCGNPIDRGQADGLLATERELPYPAKRLVRALLRAPVEHTRGFCSSAGANRIFVGGPVTPFWLGCRATKKFFWLQFRTLRQAAVARPAIRSGRSVNSMAGSQRSLGARDRSCTMLSLAQLIAEQPAEPPQGEDIACTRRTMALAPALATPVLFR